DVRRREQPQEAQKAQRFLRLLCLLWLLFPACRNNVKTAENPDPEPGVALTLATQRAQAIEGLSYDRRFAIRASPSAAVSGHEIIKFSTKDITRPLVLDFAPGAEYLTSVSVGGR